MSIRKPLLLRLMMGATFMAGMAALPAWAEPDPANLRTEALVTHDLGDLGAHAIAEAGQPQPSADPSPMPVAADTLSNDLAVAAGPTTAADAAKDSAATTSVCENYFVQSRALAPIVAPAFKAMSAHDGAALEAQLPALEAALKDLPSDEIKPEVCGGTHINAYTRHQFLELAVLRAHGIDTGLPAALPLIKQPDLAQGPLAFVVGWVKYGEKDYGGALTAFGKGLTLFPHDHGLQHEYMATLLAMKQGAQAIAFIDTVLSGTFDLDDRERASFYEGRAIGLIMLHAGDAADADFTAAQRYYFTEEVKGLQDSLQAARAAAQAKAPVVK